MPMTSLKVIPMPKHVTGEENGSFEWINVQPVLRCKAEELQECANVFAELVKRLHGVELTDADGGIVLLTDAEMEPGAYSVSCDEDGVVVRASSREGAAYGFSTLAQVMECDEETIRMPRTRIDDRPDCSYRALMVDLARQWHPFECLYEYVDLCWLYKVKYLQLHFIDTQSYTLPSDVFPKLPTQGRSYTKAQIAALVEYARSRDVELIPEIEAPGHARAMVAAYPELFGVSIDAEEKPDSWDNIVCVGKPGLMENLKRLTAEITEMFPHSRYLHIGGDEAAIHVWENCSDCRRYMQENGIEGVHALYTDFVRRMTELVLGMGRTPIVWEGFPKEGTEAISRDVVVIAWESYYHMAPDFIEEGFDIINASWQPLYITPNRRWTVENILGWNVYNWQHWWPKSDAHLNPIHLQPTKQVMGGQLCAWEWNYEGEIPVVRENLAALAERTWNIRRYAEDDEFRVKLEHVLTLAERLPH